MAKKLVKVRLILGEIHWLRTLHLLHTRVCWTYHNKELTIRYIINHQKYLSLYFTTLLLLRVRSKGLSINKITEDHKIIKSWLVQNNK